MASPDIRAAGSTDPGLRREVNEDRYHADVTRGVFFVIDGVGGHAAGGKAADVAASMLRARLERETGPVADRLREAIAIANSEIHALAATRPEWNGMACVLTAAVVRDGRATIGHVGDTRLYKLRYGRIDKVTRDHSPIGEREDTNELSEAKPCAIRGATRSTATSVPSRTHPMTTSSWTSRRLPSSLTRRCCSAATG